MTTLLTEWSKSGTLTPPNADKDGKSQDFSFIAGEYKSYSLFGRQFDSFLQKQTYMQHVIQQLLTLTFIHRS